MRDTQTMRSHRGCKEIDVFADLEIEAVACGRDNGAVTLTV